MSPNEKLQIEIDNYNDTIYAIIGFANLYIYDDEHDKMKKDVIAFQGCKLYPQKKDQATTENEDFVTPDIGILLSQTDGVIAEVKEGFPKDQGLWINDFKQIMNYDNELKGWPTADGSVNKYDIVLLLHFSRAVTVRKYYESKKGNEINFNHPFIIVEYHRSSQAKEFFSLRIQYGKLSDINVEKRLEEGVEIPMKVFVGPYSTYKIYDVEPPLPYLLEIIWTHIITIKASDDPKYSKLRHNQKIVVEFEVNEITELLYKRFSFVQFHNNGKTSEEFINHQPKYPKKNWVKRACELLVKNDDAVWVSNDKEKIKFKYVRREEILDYYKKIYLNEDNIDQIPLFPDNQ